MMKSLGSLLSSHAISTPFMKGAVAAQAVEASQKILVEIFGPEILNAVSPAYVKKGFLYIACLSSTAAQELKLNESAILVALHKTVPGASIKGLKCIS